MQVSGNENHLYDEKKFVEMRKLRWRQSSKWIHFEENAPKLLLKVHKNKSLLTLMSPQFFRFNINYIFWTTKIV